MKNPKPLAPVYKEPVSEADSSPVQEEPSAAPIHVSAPLTSHRERDYAYPAAATLSDKVRSRLDALDQGKPSTVDLSKIAGEAIYRAALEADRKREFKLWPTNLLGGGKRRSPSKPVPRDYSCGRDSRVAAAEALAHQQPAARHKERERSLSRNPSSLPSLIGVQVHRCPRSYD